MSGGLIEIASQEGIRRVMYTLGSIMIEDLYRSAAN